MNATTEQTEISPLPKWLQNPTFHLVDVLLLNLKAIAIRGVALALLAAVGVAFAIKPKYSAEAVLNIEPHVPRILYKTDPSKYLHSYEDWLRTQTDIIASHPVLDRALKSFAEAGFHWQGEDESRIAAIGRLRAKLKVVHKRETQIIVVSIDSSAPAGLDTLVNCIVDSYYIFMRDRAQSVDRFKHEFLVQERERTERDLQVAYNNLEAISRRTGVVVGNEDGLASHLQVVNELKQTVNEVMVQRVSLQNNLNSLLEEKQRIRNMDLSEFGPTEIQRNPVEIDRATSAEGKSRDLKERLFRLGERHPERRMIEGELKELQARTDRGREEAIARQVELKRQELLGKNRLKQLDVDTGLRSHIRTEHSLRKRLRDEETRLLGYNSAVLQANTLRGEIQRLELRVAEISRRIDEVSMELVVPGRIEIISRALPPETPSRDRRALFAAFAALVTFSGVTLGFLALGFLDRRIKRAEDIAAVAGFPETAAVARSPHVDPRGYRELALFLDQDRKAHGSKIFAFTPVTIGEAPAFDLAGLSRLMQDGGGRRKQAAVCAYYDDGTEAEAAVRKLRRDTRGSGAAAVWLPAVRQHSEAREWALQSDVVVLLVEGGRTTCQELEDALEQLARLKITAVSIVFVEGA